MEFDVITRIGHSIWIFSLFKYKKEKTLIFKCWSLYVILSYFKAQKFILLSLKIEENLMVKNLFRVRLLDIIIKIGPDSQLSLLICRFKNSKTPNATWHISLDPGIEKIIENWWNLNKVYMLVKWYSNVNFILIKIMVAQDINIKEAG